MTPSLLDATLASLHHLLVLSLAATLSAKLILLGQVPDGERLRLLGRLGLAHGLLVAGVGGVGGLWLAFGEPGGSALLPNPFLWFKLAAFGLYLLLAAVPTRRLRRWQRQTALPDAAVVYDLRAWVMAEMALVGLMALLAALVARGPGH